jgi:hypothetical protein
VATRVLPFTVTIPAGTPKTAPVTTAIDLDGWTLQRLDLEVPPGPAGLMGFQLYNNGVAYIPYGEDEWLVWDDVKETYYLDDQPNASGWAIVGYNDGTYDHVVTVRAHVIPAQSQAASAPPVVQLNIQTSAPPADVVTLG